MRGGAAVVVVVVTPRSTMVLSAWQALSPLTWARWGWDSLLGGSPDGGSPGSDPTMGLLRKLSLGARHDNMVRQR